MEEGSAVNVTDHSHATAAASPPETMSPLALTQEALDTRSVVAVSHNDIANTLSLFFKFSPVLEIRMPKAKLNGRNETTIAGYFDSGNLNKAVQNVMKYDGRVPGIYVSLNPVDPALLARYSNRLDENAKVTTSDKDILKRRFLLIDIDPIRPAGISSTEDEHRAAIAKGFRIKEYMAGRGWSEPIICDSGNGAGLLFATDLPNTEESTELFRKCLEAFDLLFGDEKIDIDTTVFNSARIVKLYGTTAKKGDNTKDRPHRVSSILQMPAEIRPVSLEQIKDLITILPSEEETHPQAGGGFNILAWMKQYDITVAAAKPWNGGTKYVLQECPFDTNHKYPDACIIQMKSGALVFHCFHNSCSGHDWKALRALKEPGRKQQKRNTSQAASEAPDAPTPNTPAAHKSAIVKALSKFNTPGIIQLAETLQADTPIYFDKSRNYWLWTGRYYEMVDETDILVALSDIVDDEKRIIGNGKSAILDAIRITGRKREVRDIKKTWISFQDAVIDIETSTTITPDPGYLFTVPIPHRLGASKDTPTIDRLFEEWVGVEKKPLLYEICAYCLLDDYPIHRLFQLFGRGRNGKGQFMELVLRS